MTVSSTEEKPKPTFDKKYKTIIECKFTDEYFKMIDWVNANSQGLVDVRINVTPNEINTIYIAFEDLDDALIFKIKYSI